MRTPAAVAAALLSLSLVGCSDDPVVEPLPPLPSASPSPTVVAVPSPPAEALADTPQGAAAFARYFFDVVNAALESGDAGRLREVSAPGCGTCQNLIGAAEAPRTTEERVEGGGFEIIFAEAPPAEDGIVPVELSYAIAAVRVLDGDGGEVRAKPRSQPRAAQVFLERTLDGWTVRDFVNTAA